jgi:hypothetical protein
MMQARIHGGGDNGGNYPSQEWVKKKIYKHECNFHSQCDFDTVISTHTRMISTRTVWCWHIWVWLWHSYVLIPQYACKNHSCVWCSHAYCDEHTHKSKFRTLTSVITTREVWFLHAKYNIHTQSVISTRRVQFPYTVWCWNAQMRLRYSQMRFQHAQEWFLHAECDVDTYKCDYDNHEFDYDTHEFDYVTHTC